MEVRMWGYARVSASHQKEDRQVKRLEDFGVNEHDIIVDKESGKDMCREGYQLLKTKLLRKGDILVVVELDRLGRIKADIKRELEELRDMGIRVMILNIPTTLAKFPESQEWVQDMINNILIEVLGTIAEDERKRILKRQREGIDIALEKGVIFGRPKVEVPENWAEVMARVEKKEITSVEAMSLLNLKKTSYYKLRKLMSSKCD